MTEYLLDEHTFFFLRYFLFCFLGPKIYIFIDRYNEKKNCKDFF